MTQTPSKKRKLAIWVGVALVVVAASALVISRSGFGTERVKARVDEYIAILKEKGREQNRDIDVTYESIESTGGLLDRHVRINNPVMTISTDEGGIKITTEAMEVYPKSMDLSTLRFSLPHPLDFSDKHEGNDRALLTVKTDVPLEAVVQEHVQDNHPYVKVSHTAPTAIDLTFLREERAEGQEDKTPTLVPVYDTIHITVAPESTINADVATDGSDLGVIDLAMGKITTAPESAPEGIITVEGLHGHWSSTQSGGKALLVENTMNLGPITASNDVLPYAPIHLEADLAYQGAQGEDDDTASTEAKPAKQPTFVLRKLILSTKEATLTANADFVASPTDILPSGKAEISITNTPFVRSELHKHGILNDDNEPWVSELILKATGTPFDELKDLNLVLQRENGGAFKIGNTTFEEVFAIVLKHALTKRNPNSGEEEGHAPAAAPKLPDASKPKSKPIEVPDNGVRG